MFDYEAWGRFVDRVERAVDSLNFQRGEEPYFRGHEDADFALLPSLFRGRDSIDEAREVESALFFEWQTQARELAGLPGWDLLQHMRHHSVATRLLDWTETLGVAIYFAVRSYSPDLGRTPCIWVLNPYALNEISWVGRDLVSPKYLTYAPEDNAYYDLSDYLANWWKLEFELPVAMYPVRLNPRMGAQRGYFTVHGDDLRPLDEACPDVAVRIDMAPDEAMVARRMLDFFGIAEHVLFPDLDGLSRRLAEKYPPPSRSPDANAGRPRMSWSERRERRESKGLA